MFDLEQQIREWRQSLSGALRARADAVEELESHLRDEMQRLIAVGHSPEQAWALALARLGTVQQVAGEFDKLTPVADTWLPGRIVFLGLGALACLMGGVLLAPLGRGSMEGLLASHVFTVTVGYSAVFAVGTLAIYALVARAVHGWDPRQVATYRYYVLRLTYAGAFLTALGVVLGAWWAQENMGRVWGWDPKEIGGLLVLTWYGWMVLCLQGRLAGKPLAILISGIGGNIVVSLSWFGSILIAPLHSYGHPNYGPWLAVFVLSQCLIVLLALVPEGRFAGRRAS